MANHGSIALKSSAQASLVRAVVDVTSDVPSGDLKGPKALRTLVDRLADRWLPTSDPLAKARLRGALAMRELLGSDGGALSVGEVAALLGVSRQAVDKRRRARQLLALELPRRGLLYPAWQFTESGTMPGLPQVLEALSAHDSWAQARFFVSGNRRLGRKRPIDLLGRGELEAVLVAVRAFGEHGAA